jgi:hypothetical protein
MPRRQLPPAGPPFLRQARQDGLVRWCCHFAGASGLSSQTRSPTGILQKVQKLKLKSTHKHICDVEHEVMRMC